MTEFSTAERYELIILLFFAVTWLGIYLVLQTVVRIEALLKHTGDHLKDEEKEPHLP